jgi:maleylacetate reductase
MLPIVHQSSDCSPRRACLAAALPSTAADRRIAPGNRWRCVVPGFAEYASVRRRCLHHKLCHVLGGSFDLPHARTHAVILPYAAFNLPAAPSAASRCAERCEPTRPAC